MAYAGSGECGGGCISPLLVESPEEEWTGPGVALLPVTPSAIHWGVSAQRSAATKRTRIRSFLRNTPWFGRVHFLHKHEQKTSSLFVASFTTNSSFKLNQKWQSNIWNMTLFFVVLTKIIFLSLCYDRPLKLTCRNSSFYVKTQRRSPTSTCTFQRCAETLNCVVLMVGQLNDSGLSHWAGWCQLRDFWWKI